MTVVRHLIPERGEASVGTGTHTSRYGRVGGRRRLAVGSNRWIVMALCRDRERRLAGVRGTTSAEGQRSAAPVITISCKVSALRLIFPRNGFSEDARVPPGGQRYARAPRPAMMGGMRVPDHRGLRRQVVLLVAVAAVLAACTAAGSARTSAAVLTVLTCQDSFGHSRTDPGARHVSGVGSPALYGGFTGDNTRWRSNDGHLYLAWKDPIAVAPTARPFRTITVVSPASARLLFTSPSRWATLSSTRLPILSRSVRLPACGREYSSYFGAIMVRRGACVTLAVAGPARNLGTVIVPIMVAHC